MQQRLDDLWIRARAGTPIAVDELPSEVAQCLVDGDGLFDHYGGRTPFVFVERRGDKILLIERRERALTVWPRIAVNASSAYGTGILGGAISQLGPVLSRALETAPYANDEFHSPCRAVVVQQLKDLIAEHTGTEAAEWNLTFTSTGTEAVDFALQMALLEGHDLVTSHSSRSDRDIIIAFYGAWHGWGVAPNQLLDRRQFTDGVPRINGISVQFLPFGDEAALTAAFENFKGRIKAVVAEGILGDGGVVVASPSWWERLSRLCLDEKARLIVDEILTGFRCGSFLGLPSGIKPDCVTMGKGLGLGLFPLSIVAWRTQSLSPRAGIGVRTFNLRPFQAQVVSAALELIQTNDLFRRASELGLQLRERLAELIAENPGVFKAIRGQGLFVGVELGDAHARKGREVRNELLRCGVLTEIESGTWGRHVPKPFRHHETIRLTPPLTISQEDVDEIVSSFRSFLKAVNSSSSLLDEERSEMRIAV